MEENKNEKITEEAAVELLTAVLERQTKRLFILCILLIVILVGTNLAWIVYENQFEDVSTVVTQETSSEGGGDAIIHGDNAGAVFYGQSETDGESENEKKKE